MASLGIDFGTSNCSAHAANPSGILPVRLDEDNYLLPSVVFIARYEVAIQQIESSEFEKRLRRERAEQARIKFKGGLVIDDELLKKSIHQAMKREAVNEATKKYWNQTFFEILDSGQTFIFGTPGLNAYFSDPLSGILMKSPKSFLGCDIGDNYISDFEDIVMTMLGHIKKLAEAAVNSDITSAVLGRPVRYHGTQGELGDKQALMVMRNAAVRAGFKDIRFELEPLAAAYEYESTITDEKRILVIDVGGGTTDCVMVRISPTRMKIHSRENDVLGVSGDRVGGTDFDELLAWRAFMPLFGKDSLTVNGLPVPHAVLHDAISVRDLPAQLRFSQAKWKIQDLIMKSKSPEKLARLLILQEDHLQHRLIHSAESGKIALSEKDICTLPLNYIERDLAVSIDRHLLTDATSRLVDKIKALAIETIAEAGTKPDIVFLTGGMAISPIVREAISGIAGRNIPIRSSDMLGTVGQGLGLCAQRTFEM